MQPMYTVNEKGQTEAWQLGKDGKPIKVELPPGSAIAKGIEKIDAGTKWVIRDKQSGAILGEEPKNVAGKEAEEKVGQAKGTAQAALANGADIDAAATMKKIDEFVKSAGFNEVFGQLDQYRPSWTHSDAGTDSLARYKQLKGTAFLSAYSMLKGGGAITDIEGQKAGDAMARLDRAQGEAEAKAALADFREAVDAGLKKLKRAAGGGAESAPATEAPKRIRLNADGTIAQ
jgi:flagellar protein FlgJ